jgi:hypothetical protein
MTPDELRAFRLAHLRISNPEPSGRAPTQIAKALGRLVASLGAMQAQDYPGTLWAMGLRLPGCHKAEIEAAIHSGVVVRSWPMRGTLHFVAREDLRWMTQLLTPRVIARRRTRTAQLELDDVQFGKSQETMRRVLAGGAVLTREALLGAVEADGISTAGGRGYHLLFRAAMDQVICNGPARESQLTYVLLDDWVPTSLDLGLVGEAAVAELTWRYFSSHGPATLKDFTGWSGLTTKEAKAGLAANRDRLEKANCEGTEQWWAGERKGRDGLDSAIETSARSVRLLPGFDEFLLGYKDRSLVLAPAFADRICSGGGIFQPTVAISGQVRGTWRKTFRKLKVVVEAQPFSAFNRKERDRLAEAVAQYGDFHELSGELAVSR